MVHIPYWDYSDGSLGPYNYDQTTACASFQEVRIPCGCPGTRLLPDWGLQKGTLFAAEQLRSFHQSPSMRGRLSIVVAL